MTAFKAGDKVRVKETAIPFTGCGGVVIAVDEYGNPCVRFEFTEIRDGCYSADELEKLEDAKQGD